MTIRSDEIGSHHGRCSWHVQCAAPSSHGIQMTLTLPDRPFRAYLFDCDGTIVDPMPLHYIAWREALAGWGCTFPEDLFYAWGGRPVAEIVAALNEQHGLAMPVEQVTARREALYVENLSRLQAVP